MKKFFDALKTVYGLWSLELRNYPLLSADGTSLLTDKEAIFKRWADHFDSVLNRPSPINDDAINRLPQVECNLLLDEFPTVSETVKAIKLLSSGKAPGSDSIPAEIFKAGGTPVAKMMAQLFHIMWRKEAYKRISEAEQKRAQRKARAKASPTEVSCSDLFCSICNRQFRARICLTRHLRTHKQ